MPSLPQRPVNDLNDNPPGTFDTMPASGLSAFYKYKDAFGPHTLFSVNDFYFLGTHGRKNDVPVYQSNAFLEAASFSPQHTKVILPVPTAFTTSFYTLVHVLWVPYQMRELGSINAPTHVLTLPMSQYLAALHATPERRQQNTIPLDANGDYTNDDDRFRDGIIDTLQFKGYQLISERFVFQVNVNQDSFAIQNPTLSVSASCSAVDGWRDALAAMPPNKRVPQVYGALAANKARLDAAKIRRLFYRTSVQVQLPGQTRDQFGPNLLATYDNVWPADCTVSGTSSTPSLTPAFSQAIKSSTAFYANHPNGFLLEISIDQNQSSP